MLTYTCSTHAHTQASILGALSLTSCRVIRNGSYGVHASGIGTHVTVTAGEIHGNGNSGVMVKDGARVELCSGVMVVSNAAGFDHSGKAATVDGDKATLRATDSWLGYPHDAWKYDVRCVNGGVADVVQTTKELRRTDYSAELRRLVPGALCMCECGSLWVRDFLCVCGRDAARMIMSICTGILTNTYGTYIRKCMYMHTYMCIRTCAYIHTHAYMQT
jgi:hypothetical protein